MGYRVCFINDCTCHSHTPTHRKQMTATKALVNSFRRVLFPHVTHHPPTLRVAKVRNWTSAMQWWLLTVVQSIC